MTEQCEHTAHPTRPVEAAGRTGHPDSAGGSGRKPVQGVRHDKLKLLAIFGVAGIPVVLAMVMYFGQIAVPAGRTNHGELVLPPLDAAALVTVDQSLDTPDRWTLVTLGQGPCDGPCRESIYKIRQVNVALGRDASRVRHMLWSVDQSDEELAALRAQYPELEIRQVKPDQLAHVFHAAPQVKVAGAQVFIVDPLGNLMMRYLPEQSGNHMLDDLKKLLRVSKIG